MIPFASWFRAPQVYPNLTSQRRPNQLGLRVGPSPFRAQYWHKNACYYHLRNLRHRIAYKLEFGNEINVSVDGTNSRYTERDLFLLPDGIGETV